MVIFASISAGRHAQAQSWEGQRSWPGCLPRKSTALPDDSTGGPGDSRIALSVAYSLPKGARTEWHGGLASLPWIFRVGKINSFVVLGHSTAIYSVVGIEQCWLHIPHHIPWKGLHSWLLSACLQVLWRVISISSKLWEGSCCSLPTILEILLGHLCIVQVSCLFVPLLLLIQLEWCPTCFAIGLIYWYILLWEISGSVLETHNSAWGWEWWWCTCLCYPHIPMFSGSFGSWVSSPNTQSK